MKQHTLLQIHERGTLTYLLDVPQDALLWDEVGAIIKKVFWGMKYQMKAKLCTL